MASSIRLATGEAFRIAPAVNGRPIQLAATDRVLAALWIAENGSTVRLYDTPQ